MDTGTDSSKGAKRCAKNTRESEEETLGIGRGLGHIKAGIHAKNGRDGLRSVTWAVRGFPAAPSLANNSWALAGKASGRGAGTHSFSLGKQPKPEPGKAATQPVGPETTAPPSPPGSVGRQLLGG